MEYAIILSVIVVVVAGSVQVLGKKASTLGANAPAYIGDTTLGASGQGAGVQRSADPASEGRQSPGTGMERQWESPGRPVVVHRDQ